MTENWAQAENPEVDEAREAFYADSDIWDHEFDDPNAYVAVQNARPGMYVSTADMDAFHRVIEFPVITAAGVFVNLLGGDQIGPLPVDTLIEVDTKN